MNQQLELTQPPVRHYQLRFLPGVREAVQQHAAEQDRSLNWAINDLLRKAIAAKENAPAVSAAEAS